MFLHALNSIHAKKQSAFIFKVASKKAYDKIQWSFVQQMLKLKGFLDKWIDWVMSTTRGRAIYTY